MRFLVVDDTEDLRDLMSRMVVRQGHIVEEAADGVEAVAALKERSFDFMLLDLSMPRMGGEEVVRWLNENPDRGVGLRVVVITAWAGERRAVLQELGVTHGGPEAAAHPAAARPHRRDGYWYSLVRPEPP